MVWCGKKISAEGVTHDPVRLHGLLDVSTPVTGRDLQQWVCALNWMRQSLPKFNELTEDLNIVLQRLYKAVGSNKATRLEKHLVTDHGWGEAQLAAFARTKKALANMITLAHPDPSKTFVLFPDVSHRSWGSVLTQVEPALADLPVAEQNHQPLAFLSEAFKGASLRWSTTEKESYVIVACCKRLDYLFKHPGGFVICTDHRHLRYTFGQEPDLKQPRYLAGKLARWAMILDKFTYDIRHIPGEANVWGELLSRWGNPAAQPALEAQAEGTAAWGDEPRHVMKRLVRLPLPTPSPPAANFAWPSWDTIRGGGHSGSMPVKPSN